FQSRALPTELPVHVDRSAGTAPVPYQKGRGGSSNPPPTCCRTCRRDWEEDSGGPRGRVGSGGGGRDDGLAAVRVGARTRRRPWSGTGNRAGRDGRGDGGTEKRQGSGRAG